MYRTLKPLLFQLPAETAHGAIHTVLRGVESVPPARAALDRRYGVDDDRLRVRAFDNEFPNPVGVAAGFDKNAHVPRSLAALGFGHLEVGGVTAERQPGNPKPRMFRLPEDRAIINRMGFNNDGADEIGARLDATPLPDVPVGVNIGKSKSTPLDEAADDYRYTYERVADAGDYFVVNVSSPNTPGLRDLQHSDALREILTELSEAGASPLLVKFSPDLSRDGIAAGVELAEELDLDGIIAVNTTTEREGLRHPNRVEEGGLSGAPLRERATSTVRFVAERTDLPVVGVGGVFTAADAYEKIRAGASVVQLYTGMVYRGPAIATDINRGLLDLLERDGFDSITEAVGADL
ncbi:dihydroorotate dehydrogenase [Halarchaeum rubridurum]|uniref:Dihydroorotate dehydrogenase (quinone) n=1 Tax=Halarchaeum rubridurum TaxID=489911 RepID=A0A830G4M6_9EURY|nr:quinone-dependent dihydroorotate dehydrogenase [Halarchaeum rubridurum]MBP1955996.1 dihydroorotate dehydrogenase [Halarchaeum rubridurum]GGM76064.1 dihydroorotate dehydrogenase (quinone) [Halarchaeum rubridurum]